MPPAPLFLSAARIQALGAFRSAEADAVSLHLSVDSGGLYPAVMQQVIAEAQRRDPRLKAALANDVERVAKFVSSEFVPGQRRFLAVYSCAKRGLFEAYCLPQPFKSVLTAGEGLELRPLVSLEGQYHRFVAILLSAAKARFVEIHLGEALELESFDGDFSGVDGLGKVASRAATLARERCFDRLILGGPAGVEAMLSPLLDPTLQKDLILEPVLDLVAELTDKALVAGCEVFRIMHDARFDGVCRIGAELKTPAAKTHAAPPTSRALKAAFATKHGQPSPLRPRPT